MLRPIFKYTQPASAKAAIAIQQELRDQVSLEDNFGDIRLVAGVDVGFEDKGTTSRAAAVILTYPELEVVESAIARRPTSFPYVPGLLSFREIPVLLDVLAKLTQKPDVILCDGHGYIHPRRMGIACHLGILLNMPTIGVGKNRYLGEHDEVGNEAGEWQPLIDQDETIGAVLRNRTGVKPIYVSAGHRMSLSSALKIVRQCSTKYRLPETTRLADKLSKQNGSI